MELTLKLCLHIAQYAGFIVGQLTNSCLLFLIFTRAERLFGSYRHVMAVFALFSLVYTWIEFIAQPVMHIKQSMFIVMLDSPFTFDVSTGNEITCLYCSSFALCISLLAAQFYYRYIALCQPETLEKIKGWNLTLLFIPCIVCFVGCVTCVYFGMHNTVEKQKFMRDVMFENYDVDLGRESFIAAFYWSYDKNGSRIFRFRDTIAASGCILVACFSTILYCAFKIYIRLKSAQALMSTKTRELNRQLFITLTFQTLFPFFMMYCPVGSLISFPFLEIEVGKFGNYTGAAAGIYPALEPLIAIFCIKDFRREVLCQRKKVRTEVKSRSGIPSTSFI
ncbi:Serpentine receptor class r-10 [Caenorhabditis elegans]|uniref:Serpentine receptor class r-10 n=1 Tax=Caenorhabditis elegans TaxID=6239 RepID=O16329_CAEEL|nr:Seven TM Receptor [Caenorhabditis elegans]CCD64053.2 Seven TM Receptor [Caenorhabditis elegans]|eukprot:NP_505081.2 Seven TM Receptor [Caenorhabditis elegans]